MGIFKNAMYIAIEGERRLVIKRQELFRLFSVIIALTLFISLFFWGIFIYIQQCKIHRMEGFIKNLAVVAGMSGDQIKLKDSEIRKISQAKFAFVTVYCYNSVPEQTDNSPWINASGTRVGPGQIAVSPDLLPRFPMGSEVFLDCFDRSFVITDLMNPKNVNSVDVWVPLGSKIYKENRVFMVMLQNKRIKHPGGLAESVKKSSIKPGILSFNSRANPGSFKE